MEKVMKDMAGTKKPSFNRTLSVIIAGLGLSSFIIWSLLFVLLVIGNIVYWSNFPYDMGPTSEDVLWGGVIHMLIILFLILMVPISLIFLGSGLLTFIGGLVYVRKQRPFVLTISLVANLMILLMMMFILFSSLLLILIQPDRTLLLLFILGPLILSYLVRSILTVKVIFDHLKTRDKESRFNLP
jgi:magnesium-transporting ATPase (P-type)